MLDKMALACQMYVWIVDAATTALNGLNLQSIYLPLNFVSLNNFTRSLTDVSTNDLNWDPLDHKTLIEMLCAIFGT